MNHIVRSKETFSWSWYSLITSCSRITSNHLNCATTTDKQHATFAIIWSRFSINIGCPDSKIHGTNMGPTWVRSAPGGHHVSPMNLAIGLIIKSPCIVLAGRMHLPWIYKHMWAFFMNICGTDTVDIRNIVYTNFRPTDEVLRPWYILASAIIPTCVVVVWFALPWLSYIKGFICYADFPFCLGHSYGRNVYHNLLGDLFH